MPFLRLTRDRRGFENTFLMHASHPGEKPRVLYWYRTAPGIIQGRSPLDEEAIRTIEDQHPDIEFDWPAILALSEVMTPEEEAPRPPKPQQQRKQRREREEREPRRDDRAPDLARENQSELRPNDGAEDAPGAVEAAADDTSVEPAAIPANRLLDELVGREIATRLRARYSEVMARIHEPNVDAAIRDGWLKRADALNPDLWVTPDAILEGVRNADKLFDQLRGELTT